MNRALAISCVLCFAASAFGGHLIRKSGGADPEPADDEFPGGSPTLSALPGTAVAPASVRELATELSHTNRAADFARLMKSAANTGRDHQNLIMLRWAEVDPRAAFEFLRDGGVSFKEGHAMIVFKAWARIDPEAAFSKCKGFGSGGTEAAASKAALDGAFEVDPDRAFALFFETQKGLRESSQFHGSGGVFERPEITLTMIDKHGRDSRWGRTARMFLLETFAEEDPQGLLAWSQNHLDGLGNDIGQVVSHLAGSDDPSLAIKLYSSLPPERITTSIISSIAALLAKTDPAAGLELVAQNTKGKARIDAQTSMLRTFASQDPAAAAPAIKEFIVDSARPTEAVRSLMESWAKSSPQDAAVWAQTLESEGVRGYAEKTLSKEWFNEDQDGISTFINEASVDEVSVAFLSGIATGGQFSLGSDGNNRRFEWLRSMPEHHSRRVIGEVFEATSEDDPRLAVSEVVRFDSAELRTAAVGGLLGSELGAADGGLGTLVAKQEDPELHKIFLEALTDPSLDAERAAAVAAQIRAAE